MPSHPIQTKFAVFVRILPLYTVPMPWLLLKLRDTVTVLCGMYCAMLNNTKRKFFVYTVHIHDVDEIFSIRVGLSYIINDEYRILDDLVTSQSLFSLKFCTSKAVFFPPHQHLQLDTRRIWNA